MLAVHCVLWNTQNVSWVLALCNADIVSIIISPVLYVLSYTDCVSCAVQCGWHTIYIVLMVYSVYSELGLGSAKLVQQLWMVTLIADMSLWLSLTPYYPYCRSLGSGWCLWY